MKAIIFFFLLSLNALANYTFTNMELIDNYYDHQQKVQAHTKWSLLVFNSSRCNNLPMRCFPFETKLDVFIPNFQDRIPSLKVFNIDTFWSDINIDYGFDDCLTVALLYDNQIIDFNKATYCSDQWTKEDLPYYHWINDLLQKTINMVNKINQ
ncbi:MAG: hypothetical protein N4A33_01515 [Bacteriovoracaceae bacterium]|jgi:hypothetical protein|nr:hypothetical protein [Bacteriovoracaceae bacterium]